jgi:hypothetical protein
LLGGLGTILQNFREMVLQLWLIDEMDQPTDGPIGEKIRLVFEEIR